MRAANWGMLSLLFDLSALMLDTAFAGQRWTRVPGIGMLLVALACGALAIVQGRRVSGRERVVAFLSGAAGAALSLLFLYGALVPQTR